MSESAISAKSAKQIFANFVKFVKSIFGTTRRSEGSVTGAEYPTNYQRISNLLLTIRPFRVAILAVLLVFVGGWSSEVLGKEWKWKVSVAVANGTGGKAVAEVFKSGAFGIGGSVEKSTGDVTSSTTVSTYSTENHLAASSNHYHHYIFTATAYDGYSFGGWYTSSNVSGNASSTTNPLTGDNDNDGFDETRYAKFIPVTVSTAGSAAAVSFNHPETKTVTLYFPVSSNADEAADFNAPTITSNKVWTIKSWSLNTNTHKVEVVCQFIATSNVAKGDYEATVTLKAKSNKSNTGKVTANVDLTPILTYDNGSVDISVSDADKTTLDVSSLKSAYKGADNVAGDGAITYALKTANSNVSLTSAGIFYAKALGTYTIVATAAKGRYYAKTAEFTVTVGKRTPTFEWWNADGATHIYASDVLENVAQAKYNENNVDELSYSYKSDNGIVVVDGTSLRVQNTFVGEHNVKISVSTVETDYYKAGSASHTYLIEPKATPEFWLNEEVNLPADPVDLNLLIGETATMRFVNTDESNGRFTYPIKPSYVSYEHNSDAHTGVITGTVAGDEEIQFHQTGTTTIFEHSRKIHVYVNKHPVNLTTTLDGGTWKVDSIYDGAVYSIVTPTGSQPALSEVSVTSSNEAVLKKVDGHWKAVGEGEATLTITHPSTNAYWAGQTVTATITVVKHTPVITWNLDASYPWGAIIESPVSSSNEELPFTVESNNPEIANYVNGRIEVYNKVGNVTFTLTQNGNYKWNAANANLQFTINSFKPQNHLPMDLKAGNYSHYKSYVTSNVSWANSGVQCGTAGGGFNWDDKYIELHFTGVPNHLTFDYKNNNNVLGDHSGVEWFIQTKTENGEWSSKQTWSDNSGSKDFALSPDVSYVRLCYSGNYGGLFTNIKVTERREVVATPKSLTFATADVDASAQTLPVQIDWYNVKTCTATIEGANAGFFQLKETDPIAASLDHFGTETLHVTYAYPQAGTHTATLKVESEDGYKVEVPLSATSLKVTPAITWKENLSPMSRGENVTNPATSPVTLSYSSSDETIVAVEGNVLKPLKKGEATITASFDGTSDLKWNSASSTIDVEVTDMHVQHINWPQTFTRLKYTTDPALSDKNTEDFPLTATVSYYDLDNQVEVALDRTITFTSGDESVVKVLEGNILHVVGLGETTLSAHVDGVADEYLEATITRKVKVREPSTDCDTYIVEDAHASMATGVTSFNGEETVIDLNGQEPGYVSFSAWREIIKVVIDYTGGDLYLSQYVNGQWSNDLWHNGLEVDNPKEFGPIALNRHATKIKLYKKTGSTGIHAFSDCNVTLARYLELDNTEGKTSTDIYFSTADAKPGVAKTKSFTVNYSNITDQLQVDYEGSDKFSVTPTTIGEECGDKGKATVQVTFLSNDVDHYEGTITIHNLNQSVTVHLSADVDKHNQHITWNPVTELKTTDVVSFDATTSAAAAGLSVRYEVVDGDAATVNAETGALTIIKDGTVTIKATAEGNDSYHDAEPVSKTFTISKVTPTIATVPTAATMTMPNTSLADCELTGGEASVAGTFAWADNTINAIFNNTGYTVIFTPENTNWYSSVSCVVVVPVNKMIQTITWDFAELEMYPNAQVIFDASTNAGLPVSYTTSDETIAYVDGENRLRIIRGGEVTITAMQGGNETYAAAEPVSKTLTINRFAPEIVTLPNASSMKIGRVLSDASLSGGRAELNGEKVEGSFAWVDGNTTVMNVAGTFSKEIVFNPSNANLYEPVYGSMQDVSVEKYAPVITQNLHGSAITYGDALSASTLSGSLTATDYIKIPSEEVDGSYGWLQPSALLNAGTQNAIVRFTPTNMDWYEAVDFPVQLTVNRASTDGLTVTGVSEILHGQILGEAVPENTTANPVHGGIVAGEMNWDASLDMEEYKEIGTYHLPATLVVNDPNYIPATLNGTVELTVKSGFAFKGNNGTDWNDESNWSGPAIGLPGASDPVLIMSDVVVSTNVTVDAMTIRQGVKVTVADGGSLTVKNGDAVQRNVYGNLIVEFGGEMEVENGTMHVHDFTLKAKLGDVENPGKSGQVFNPASLDVRGNAYFDLALDPSGECSKGWYDFTVPFPVDALNGVTRFRNSDGQERTIQNEVNYAIMDFSESRRLETGYGWKKYRSVMQPGQCYTITIDDVDNVYRFKKVKDGAFNNQMTAALAYTDVEDNHRGWNGLGNGTMAYIDLSAENIEKVQVYCHETNSYTAIPMNSYTYVVGSSFFVQAPTASSMMEYSQEGATHTLRAPKRETAVISEFALTLAAENATKVADRFYVSASEEASDNYTIGRELTKFGAPTDSKTAQMWTNAYGMKLCDVELSLVNNEANCELGLFAPKSGVYEIAIENAPEDASLYLTYNDQVIWDLTASPYVIDLAKGTTEGYGLRIAARAPQIATGVEETNADSQSVRKVLINNTIYLVTPEGKMYDIVGKSVKY